MRGPLTFGSCPAGCSLFPPCDIRIPHSASTRPPTATAASLNLSPRTGSRHAFGAFNRGAGGDAQVVRGCPQPKAPLVVFIRNNRRQNTALSRNIHITGSLIPGLGYGEVVAAECFHNLCDIDNVVCLNMNGES